MCTHKSVAVEVDVTLVVEDVGRRLVRIRCSFEGDSLLARAGKLTELMTARRA
jgi:hypothetical protein